MDRWILLLLVASLPTAASAIVLAAHGRVSAHRGPWLPLPAGPWLEQTIARLGRTVRIEVQPTGTPDAWWPNTGAIGLSARTWGGCRPGHWAIAAHELGHALNATGALATVLPAARLADGLAWRTFVAGAALALLGTLEALPIALAALSASVATAVLVCADEALASVRALRLLRADPRIRGEALAAARLATVGAGSAYVAGGLARAAVLACWPAVERVVSGPAALPRDPSSAALWCLLALLPFLVFRALHGLREVLAPEPVTSDLQLASVVHRESVMELGAAAGVAVLCVGLHATSTAPVFVLAVVLALGSALGPLAGVVLGVLSVPFAIRREPRDTGFPPVGRAQDAPPALLALWSEPPWYVRAGRLASLAYLPMLAAFLWAMWK